MSVLAEVERSKRQSWAAAGGAHDRVVRSLAVILPSLVGALAAVLVFAPFAQRSEIGFLLAKDAIEIAPQRLRVDAARYTGSDANGRPFTLSARNAIQRSAADPIVRLTGLSAMLVMQDGPATFDADRAMYDPPRDRVMVDGPVRFVAADGYRLATADVDFDLKQRTLASGRGVSGTLPIGRFTADRISADLQARVVRLSGNARLRINQGFDR